ncbi:TPA: hypothetical protein ACNFPT_004572 [Enterobacter ludwigii]
MTTNQTGLQNGCNKGDTEAAAQRLSWLNAQESLRTGEGDGASFPCGGRGPG